MTTRKTSECDHIRPLLIDEATNGSGQHAKRVHAHLENCDICKETYEEQCFLTGRDPILTGKK